MDLTVMKQHRTKVEKLFSTSLDISIDLFEVIFIFLTKLNIKKSRKNCLNCNKWKNVKKISTHHSNLSGDVHGGGALLLVELGHDGVSRMGHNGTEDTSDVAGGESDNQLLALGAFSAGLRHYVSAKKPQVKFVYILVPIDCIFISISPVYSLINISTDVLD